MEKTVAFDPEDRYNAFLKICRNVWDWEWAA